MSLLTYSKYVSVFFHNILGILHICKQRVCLGFVAIIVVIKEGKSRYSPGEVLMPINDPVQLSYNDSYS